MEMVCVTKKKQISVAICHKNESIHNKNIKWEHKNEILYYCKKRQLSK